MSKRIRLNYREIAFTLLVGLAMGAGVYAGLYAASEPPPCETEDCISCAWDADTMGNGEGRSFTVDDAGNVTYLP